MEDHRRNGHDAKEAAAKGIPADAHECDTPELGPGAPEHELRISPTAVRIACIVAVLITAVVAAASFVLSFASLADLAQRSGYPAELAKLWPVIVDLTIVLATVAVIVLGPAGVGSRAHRRYFWAVLAISAIISVGGNALHGYLPPDTALWPWLAACIAAVAPLSLLATVHGAATMLRISAFVSRRTPAADAFADTPTAEAPIAEAHDTPVREGVVSPAPRNGQRKTPTLDLEEPVVAPALDPISAGAADSDPRADRRAAAAIDTVEPATAPSAATTAPEVSTGWMQVATTLVRDGATQKSVDQTAQVLALWDQKLPFTVIARQTELHHSTVRSIIEAARRLLDGAEVGARA